MTDSERMVWAATFGAVMAECKDPNEYGTYAGDAVVKAFLAVQGLQLAKRSDSNSDTIVMAREFSGYFEPKGNPS